MPDLIIFGDSIAAGAWGTHGGWAARLITDLHLRCINDLPFHCFGYNLSISGDTSETLLSRFESELRARHESDEPLIVIFAVGVNDSQFLVNENRLKYAPAAFIENMSALYEIAVSRSARVLILGPAPVDESKVNPMPWGPECAYRNKHIQELNDLLKEFCAENGIENIDLYQAWIKEDYKSWLFDGVHPNSEGHQRIHKLVAQRLENAGFFEGCIQDW